MPSELERLLREGRGALPEPDPDVTRRARARALAAVAGGGRRRLRSRILLAGALAVAVVSGVGIGASIAPSGSAAEGPVGFGFLPERGWHVVQNGADATPGRPALAIASTVPLDSGDGSSIVPYATLQSLPPDGIVLVASVVGRDGSRPPGPNPLPSRELPLSIDDASPGILYSAQIRPEEPLGQYQLRGAVNGYTVDLHLYFGTQEPSGELLAEAQRQLDRLVISSVEPAAPAGATRLDSAPSASQSVTLAIARIYDPGNRIYRLRFSGTISSRAVGEYVSVERRLCGSSFFTAFAGAQTREGGFWEAENYGPRPGWDSNTYRARWNNTFSTDLRFRGRVLVSQRKVGDRRFRVVVSTNLGGSSLGVNLRGRTVLLQRRVGGTWTTVGQEPLAAGRSFGEYLATFTVPRRRWTLRAVLPARSGRPCYTTSVSETWVS